jgi:predicted transcriptional regulator
MTLDASYNKPVDMTFRRQYRTSFGITCDILQACMDAGMDGIPVSRVSQKANLSHNAVMCNCQRLVEAGMISANKSKRKYILTITEKGIKLYYELERFQDTIKEIKIRY